MKVWRVRLLCLTLLTLMILPATGAGAAAKHDITILGGSSGGLTMIMCEGIGETVRRSFPDFRTTTEPGKDGPNQVMVNRNEVQFALVSDLLTIIARNGEAPFKQKLDKLRLVAVINPTTVFQIFVDNKTGLTKFQDVKDQKYPLKIAVNRQGTLMDIGAEEILKAYGISYNDIASWGGKVNKIPGPEAMDMWDAGQLNAIVENAQFPVSRYYDLGQKHSLRLFSIDEEILDKLNKQLGSTSITIPAGTYPFQKEDCRTLCTQLVLVTSADQPDEMVESVLKSMNDNIAYLRNVHVNLRDLTPEIMAGNTTIPMHPAAEKFYKSLNQ